MKNNFLEIPELDGLPMEERLRVWQMAEAKASRSTRGRLLRLVTLLAAASGPFFGPIFSIIGVRNSYLAWGLGAFAAIFVAQNIEDHFKHLMAMKILWEYRENLCDKCGYNTSGILSARCPECGQAIR